MGNDTTVASTRFIIRKMEPQDMEEVGSIETASSLTPWSKAMFLAEMAHPYASCFVMTPEENVGNPVIGFICFRNMGEESELLNVSIHPDYRHAGHGRRLMQFYTDYSVQRGVRRFHLEVLSTNRSAVGLYQAFLYRRVGVGPRFYRGQFDALRMMKRV